MTPRICMPSWRQFTRRLYQCSLYEAQDVLHDAANVDLICLEPNKGFRLRDTWHRRLLYHDISKQLVSVNPGLKRVRLTEDYDVFVVLCQNYEEILYLSAIDGWKDRCKTSICLIEEMWTASIPTYQPWLHALQQFDHVFLITGDSAAALSKATGRPCHGIPSAVDALRFSPRPQPPLKRTIDVFSIGRRPAGVHASLAAMAARGEIFYIHDTAHIATADAYDHREHRDMLANVAKRANTFLVAPAKASATEETQGQVEIGNRFYEGAAAGCVMIGQKPDSDLFRRLFDWPDAVVDVRPDGSDVADAVRSLCGDQSRLARIGQRNATEALLRHDWIYRWREILRIAGFPPSAGMVAREERLTRLANSMELVCS